MKKARRAIDDMRVKSGYTEDGNEFIRLSSKSPLHYSGLDLINPLSGGFLLDRRAVLKYESGDTYRWSDAYLEMMDENPVHPITALMREAYRPPESKLVHSGRWVLIMRFIPAERRPERWGIYWAVPFRESKNYDGYGEDGMYRASILVPTANGAEYVSIHPHEYMVLDEHSFKEETEDLTHYTVRHINRPSEGDMSLELIGRGRALTEEERESIWALMLDGLTELQACQEYFMSRHIEEENASIWYRPTAELVEALDNIFGPTIESIGKPLRPRRRSV